MVLITPRLVRALDPDEVPPLPTTPDDLHQEAPAAPPRGRGGVGGQPRGWRRAGRCAAAGAAQGFAEALGHGLDEVIMHKAICVPRRSAAP